MMISRRTNRTVAASFTLNALAMSMLWASLQACTRGTSDTGMDSARAADGGTDTIIIMNDDHRAAVEALVKPIIEGGWVSGMVVGLVSDQGRELYAWGTSDDSGKVPDAKTIWEIGSITKTVNNLLLAQQVGDGTVRLDQPLQTLMPADRVSVPTRNDKAITLEQLATHTSGLPGVPDNLQVSAAAHPDDPYASYSEALLFDFLNNYQLTRDPGSEWEYSNLGGGLLGYALARQAQQPWAALIASTITEPLALTDTVATLSNEQRARFAQPHDADLSAVPEWTFDALASAGALRSSADDMLAYVALQAGLTHCAALDDAVALSHAPRFDIPASSGLANNQMGLGWLLQDGRFLWHNGGTAGSGSFVGADPLARTGVVVLSNTESEAFEPQTQLGHALQELMAGQDPAPVDLPPPPVTLPTSVLDRYTGDFAFIDGSDIVVMTVAREPEGLTVRIGQANPQRLQATSETAFYSRWLPVTLTFHAGPTQAGDAWEIVQGEMTLTAPRR